jgi:toxin ParE1/3/4
MDQLFSQAATRQTTQPQLGRISKIEGTRALIVHKRYCLVYEIRDNAV